MPSVQHKRGTRAALDALAASSGLLPGEVYLLTDEQRLAVALSTSTYQSAAKANEAPVIMSDGWSYASLAADFNDTTVTGALVPGLSFAAAVNTVYELELIGSFQTAAATTGVAAVLDTPAGASVTGMAIAPSANNGSVQVAAQRASGVAIGPTAAVGTAAAAYPIIGRWLVSVGATAGAIQMRWRSEVAGSEARLMAGAVLKMRSASNYAAPPPQHVVLTQAAYDALAAPDEETFYYVSG